MKLRFIATSTLLAAGLLLATEASAALAQAPQGQAKPEAKPETQAEPKTDASIAGKWTVSLQSQNGPMESALELKIDPKDNKKVTGTFASQMGTNNVEGQLADGKVTFGFAIDAGGNTLSITFVGALQKDGSMAGTLSFGQGEIPWTAVRVKG